MNPGGVSYHSSASLHCELLQEISIMAPLKYFLLASIGLRQALSLPASTPAEDWLGGGQTEYSWSRVKYMFSL